MGCPDHEEIGAADRSGWQLLASLGILFAPTVVSHRLWLEGSFQPQRTGDVV